MTLDPSLPDRRVSSRVEVIVMGWWKQEGSKFERCKTLDLSMDGALLVLDRPLVEGTKFELHLDMEADWQIPFDAEVLWQRPIFYGKQQLTAVKHRFQKSQDRSMFGLWCQRQLANLSSSARSHLDPVVLSSRKPDIVPTIEPAPKISLIESGWKRTFSHLTAKIPWFEVDPLPHERRSEARGQVGLTVDLESEAGSWKADFLNVSQSGVSLFIPFCQSSGSQALRLVTGSKVELSLSESNLLLGASRCSAQVVWTHKAEREGDEDVTGLVVGLCFPDKKVAARSFVRDLLRRINYNPRQVRSEMRFPREIKVLVQFDGEDRVKGETIDISTGGAQIQLPGVFETPQNVTVHLDLSLRKGVLRQVALSSRLLRHAVDKQGRNCYAVAFRKGQTQEQIELSRWLAVQLPMQGLSELIPNFSKGRSGDDE